MNIKHINNAVTRKLGRKALQVQKYSPQILTGVGIVTGVAAAVVGAKATLNLEPIVDEMEQDVANIKTHIGTETPTKHINRAVGFAYGKAGVKVIRLYAPAVTLGVISISCVIGAQGIMQKRQAALVAAYTTIERTLSEYRTRVEEQLGEEKERELFYGLQTEKGKDADGNEQVGIKGDRPNNLSGYSRFFDDTSKNWQRDAEFNKFFLTSVQNQMNDRLRAKGYVFLNEVYAALDVPLSKAGQQVGWVYDPQRTDNGDNYIDFGIYKDGRSAREFANGRETSILLDFNVDGPVLDLVFENQDEHSGFLSRFHK